MTDEHLRQADLTLLTTIRRLTETYGGRPPTLAEIARELGLQVSSRGNIQRQLSRLRPKYVNWGRQARSLKLTELAESVLESTCTNPQSGTRKNADNRSPEAAIDSIPVSVEVLMLLASGLTQMADDVADNKPIQAPYPDAWRRGLNRLAAECILRGALFPISTPEAIEWCIRPLSEWPICFDGLPITLDAHLLEDDQPTSLCRELAFDRDAELQASEHSMKRLLGEARLRQMPEAYVQARRFLIQNPVVQDDVLADFALNPEMLGVGNYLFDMYEKVPVTTQIGQEVLLCGNCGWTLEMKNGALQCGDRRCAVLTDRFSKVPAPIPYSQKLWRVRRAIRRYIVAPGKYELDLANKLEVFGVHVDLWPQYDAYDLRVVFPDGQTWAIDVKDWQNAYQLVQKLVRIPKPAGGEWQRGFYAIPDQRLHENPNYISILRSRELPQDTEVVSISELVRRAERFVSLQGTLNGQS